MGALRSHAVLLLFVGCLLGTVSWLFAGALFRDELFLFRDAAHFYYPLLTFTAEQWRAGHVPLWNPYEQLGVPLAATGTSGAFYPGILLFLVGFSPATAYRWYVVGHVLLAAANCWWIARRLGITSGGAALAALSYALGGAVLFQYCNVVYLVGAAWLPWSLWFSIRLTQVVDAEHSETPRLSVGYRGENATNEPASLRSRWPAAVGLGVVWALMICGGDPHLVYNSALVAGGLVVSRWWSVRAAPVAVAGERRSLPCRWQLVSLFRGGTLLALAAAVAAATAAVQLLPSAELSSHTDRAVREQPRTLWELADDLVNDRDPTEAARGGRLAGLLARTSVMGPHGSKIYHFSHSPWRIVELAWPGVGGRIFPLHQWLWGEIPAEGRTWTPSIYLGLLPVLLALLCWGTRLPWPWQTLKWIVIVALVASWGQYGVGFVLRELTFAFGGDPRAVPLGDAFGGLYWLLVTVLPGYVYFRYPAKWLVIAALGMALLAGWKWDQLEHVSARRLLQWLFVTSGVSTMLWIISLWLPWHTWLNTADAEPLFGPFDAEGAVRHMQFSFLHAACLAAVLAGLLLRFTRRATAGPHFTRGGLTAACVVLTAVDLAIAGRWLVPAASAELWHAPSAAGEQILQYGSQQSIARVYRDTLWLPKDWRNVASPQRQVELVRWDRDTLWPKYNLEYSVSVLRVLGTVSLAEYSPVLEQAARITLHQIRDGEALQPGTGLSALGTEYYLLPEEIMQRGDDHPPPTLPEQFEELPLIDTRGEHVLDARLLAHDTKLPRAWITREFCELSSLDPRSESELRMRVRWVWGTTSEPIGVVGNMAWLEEPAPAWFASDAGATVPTAREHCTLQLGKDPGQLDIDVVLHSPALVVLADQFYPGWTAEVSTNGGAWCRAPIVRANIVMRGVWLTAGEHRLRMQYRPRSFLYGAWISSVACGVLIALGCVSGFRRLR